MTTLKPKTSDWMICSVIGVVSEKKKHSKQNVATRRAQKRAMKSWLGRDRRGGTGQKRFESHRSKAKGACVSDNQMIPRSREAGRW